MLHFIGQANLRLLSRQAHLCFQKGKRKPLYLKYENEHYTCLQKPGSEASFEQIVEGPQSGIRGAAESSCGTRSSVKRRLCAGSTYMRSSVKRRMMPHATPKNAKSAAMHPQIGGRATSPKHDAASNRSAKTKERFQWQCNLCIACVTAKNARSLTQGRHNHAIRCHPGRLHEVAKIRQTPDIVEVAQWPSNLRSWTCSWCGLGLPDLPRYVKNMSTIAHLAIHRKRGRILTLKITKSAQGQAIV